MNVQLGCSCGAVRGVVHDVSPATVGHVVCHCKDCRAFALVIDRGPEVLDAHGGTHLVHLSPASVEITSGLENLVCLRLTSKGMVRWYTSCCRTPVGNTMLSPRPPFIGMFLVFMDRATTDEQVGPVRARLQTGSATGDRSTLVASRFPVGFLIHTARLMTRWWLRGDAATSPLRDAAGAPRVTPRVLSAEELERVRPNGNNGETEGSARPS